MAYRTGNNYRVFIGKETTLGSGKTNSTSILWTEGVVLPDTIEASADITPIETGNKTQTGLPTICETTRGYEQYTITLTGNLSDDHELLLNAFGLTPTGTPVGTYTMDALPSALNGYVILRVWSDAPTGTPAADTYTVDKASGCQLMKLTLSGSSGDLVKYEAVFMAQTWAREQTQEITGADPGTVCTEAFNFGNVEATLSLGSGDCLKTFSLSIEHELADDAAQFQNSNTRLETIPVKEKGELTYTTNYDTAGQADHNAETYLHGTTDIANGVTLDNSTKIWEISTIGQLTSYQLADPGIQLFENNATFRLVSVTGEYPFICTISAVTP